MKNVKIVSLVHLAYWWSCIGNGLGLQSAQQAYFCLYLFVWHNLISSFIALFKIVSFVSDLNFCWHSIYDVWTNHAYHVIWYKLWFASFDSTKEQNCTIIQQPKQLYYITITVYFVHDILWSVLVTEKNTLLIQWKIMKDWRKMKITNDQLSETLFWPGSKYLPKRI